MNVADIDNKGIKYKEYSCEQHGISFTANVFDDDSGEFFLMSGGDFGFYHGEVDSKLDDWIEDAEATVREAQFILESLKKVRTLRKK